MQSEFYIETKNKNEMVDITAQVMELVKSIKDGICLVYTPHATAAVIINENYDPNIMLDVIDALDNLIQEGKWRHDKVDNNGAAHIKSAIIGPSELIPIKNGKLELGTWQGIVLCDFDGPRKRKVIIKIINT